MSPQGGQPSRTVVQITCDGELPTAEWPEFEGWEITSGRGTTVLTAQQVDQAALHGALDRLGRQGLHVVEVLRRPVVEP